MRSLQWYFDAAWLGNDGNRRKITEQMAQAHPICGCQCVVGIFWYQPSCQGRRLECDFFPSWPRRGQWKHASLVVMIIGLKEVPVHKVTMKRGQKLTLLGQLLHSPKASAYLTFQSHNSMTLKRNILLFFGQLNSSNDKNRLIASKFGMPRPSDSLPTRELAGKAHFPELQYLSASAQPS